MTVTVVGFVLATTLVVVMARRSTAAWEREKRAAAVPRRRRADAPPASGGAADRARAVLVRGAATGLRLSRSVRTRLATAGRLVAGPAERLGPPARALRKAARRLTGARSASGAGDRPPPAIGVAHPWAVPDGEAPTAPAVPQDDGAAPAPGDSPGREPQPEARPRRRRPLRLPHRHGPRPRVTR